MKLKEARQIIDSDIASFSAWVTAAGVITSSEDSTLDDLISCLGRKGLPAEMAAATLYVRTKRPREDDFIESFVVDKENWVQYLRKA